MAPSWQIRECPHGQFDAEKQRLKLENRFLLRRQTDFGSRLDF